MSVGSTLLLELSPLCELNISNNLDSKETGFCVIGTGFCVIGTGFFVIGTGFFVIGTGFFIIGFGDSG